MQKNLYRKNVTNIMIFAFKFHTVKQGIDFRQSPLISHKRSSNRFSFIFCWVVFDVILTFPIICEISHFSPETFITVGKEWILQQVLKLGLSQKSRQIDIVLEKIFLISPEIVWYFGKQWQTNIRFRKLEQRKWKWKTCWQSSKVLFSKEN